MPTIDLRRIPITICTSKKTQHRLHEMLPELATAGFATPAIVKGKQTRPYWVGLNASHHAALQQSLPRLVFEDDARFTSRYRGPILSHPTDADVLYLGTVPHGKQPPLPPPWRKFVHRRLHPDRYWHTLDLYWQPHDEAWTRIGNMLGTHAYLVLTNNARRKLQAALTTHQPTDVAYARVMPTLRVYARRVNYWYQNDQHNEAVTTVDLDTILPVD